MIFISSRRNFTDPDYIYDNGHLIKEIDLETDNSIRDINTDELLNTLKNKSICILVHGYNNEYYEVCDAYEIIENQINNILPDQYQYIIGYCWPGGNNTLEWYDAKSRSNSVARKFRQILETLRSHVSSVDIISHSLGARVTLKALKESSQILVNNYYCMAGAVDNESLEPKEEFSASLNSLNTIYVMHSARDGVLATAYRAAEFDNALGLFGPEDKNVVDARGSNIYVANCKRVVDHHGGYKRSNDVFSYISRTKLNRPRRFDTL